MASVSVSNLYRIQKHERMKKTSIRRTHLLQNVLKTGVAAQRIEHEISFEINQIGLVCRKGFFEVTKHRVFLAQTRLNFGDCAAFALAKSLNAPLLFKGEDFASTDVLRAI